MQQQQINLDLSKTTAIKSESGNQLFGEAFLLRKVSRLLTGAPRDQVAPISVFYDLETKEILKDSLPKELWAEFGFKEEAPKLPGLSIVK